MTTVRDIYDSLCELAPIELQMSFDNAGLLLGHTDAAVKRSLLALDVTDEVVEEAIEAQAGLIISHHPLIFHPLKSVTDETPEGRRVLRLIENGIAVISMHTNLDIAEGGVNDVLLKKLGAEAVAPLDEDGCGRIGELDSALPMRAFLAACKAALGCEGLRYFDSGRQVKKLAVMGGSGADSITRAAELGCDTYVTADIKYHQFQTAADLGINLIDGDHFYTENPVIPELEAKLSALHPEVLFFASQRHHAIIRFY